MPPPAGHPNPTLFHRTDRLARFDRWLREDPELAGVFDSVLKERVRAAARKQAVISAIVAILSLIAGWLLNAFSPINVLNLLPH
jgi:hypothetical protein